MLARQGVASAAAEAVEVGLALDHEPLALDNLTLIVKGRRVRTNRRFPVGLATRDSCEQGTCGSVERIAANIEEVVAKRKQTRGY